MKVTTEKVPPAQAVLNIELEPEETERSLSQAYRRLVNRVQLPGFRKGKAPRDLLERYLGREALMDEAINHLVPEVLSQAIRDNGLDPIAEPQVEVLQREPITLKATISLRPSVDLGNYRDLRLQKDEVQVTEEDIIKAQERLRYQQAPWVPAPERSARFGDLLTLDGEATSDGVQAWKVSDYQFVPLPDSPYPVPGFSQKLEGLEKGETREFDLSFPPGYPDEALAGRSYRFKVALKDIKEKRLPELDDAFAQSLGEGLDGLAALRERLKTNLQAQRELEARLRFQSRVVEETVKGARVEFPPLLIDREVERLLEEREEELKAQGLTLESYLEKTGRSQESLVAELRPLALDRVTTSLVLSKVAEEEKLQVSEEELKDEIARLEQENQGPASRADRETLRRRLLARKVIARLTEIATGPPPQGPASQLIIPGRERPQAPESQSPLILPGREVQRPRRMPPTVKGGKS